jgi:predicted GNAT family N-acyltransferase
MVEAELGAVLALREAVFCGEQGVPRELEHDGRDATAVHVVAVDGREVVGTCRLLADGDVWRLGRMAVRRDRRGRGVGAAILGAAHREAAKGGARVILLAAQTPVRDFYARYGYVARGDVFMEAGIPHVMMSRPMEGATA